MRGLSSVTVISVAALVSPLMGLLITPFILDFYSKENFGELAFFLSIVTIVGSLSTARLELTIANCRTAFAKAKTAHLAFSFIHFVSIPIVFCIVIVLSLIFTKSIIWAAALFIASLLFAYFQILFVYRLSQAKANTVAISKMSTSSAEPMSQLIFAKLFGGSLTGLVGSWLIGMVISFLILKRKLKGMKLVMNKNRFNARFIKYKQYIKQSSTGYLANGIALHGMPVYFVFLFSSENVGEIALLQRTVGAVFFLFSSVFAQLFIINLSKALNLAGNQTKITYKKTILGYFGISLGLFLSSSLIWPKLTFLLPDEWTVEPLVFYSALALYSVQAVVVPISSFLIIKGLTKTQLLWDLTRLMCLSIVLTIAFLFNSNFSTTYALYSLVMISFYFVLIVLHFAAFKKDEVRE